MSGPRIFHIAPTPFPDLIHQIEQLIATHPEATDLTRQCLAIALLVIQIEQGCPGYAHSLAHELQQRQHRLSPRCPHN